MRDGGQGLISNRAVMNTQQGLHHLLLNVR